MTIDPTAKAIQDLEHFLFDVWGWDELFEIAHEVESFQTSGELPMQGRRDADMRLIGHMTACYRAAIAEVERVLNGIERDDILDALLARMAETLRSLRRPGACYWEWLSRNPDYPFGQHLGEDFQWVDGTFSEQRHDIEVIKDKLSFVERDLDYFVSKVIQGIEREWINPEVDQSSIVISEDPTSKPVPVHERIRWIGTAALFAQLIHELTSADRITPPQRNGEPNWAATARTIYAAFDIRKGNEEPITISALTQALKPEGDRDIKGGKAAFTIKPRK